MTSSTPLERWEARLKRIFDDIDREFEQSDFAKPFSLHPVRPPSGATSNCEDDGLFDLGASFTAGIGSVYGPGYEVQVRLATLQDISPELQQKLEEAVVKRLREKLPEAFPGVELAVDRDGPIYKIHGDLSLDGV